jgi:hypothetical protein
MASAATLTDKLDSLAVALRDAGISPERMATILGSAATATMNALLLDAVLEENLEGAPTTAQPDLARSVDEPLRAAA